MCNFSLLLVNATFEVSLVSCFAEFSSWGLLQTAAISSRWRFQFIIYSSWCSQLRNALFACPSSSSWRGSFTYIQWRDSLPFQKWTKLPFQSTFMFEVAIRFTAKTKLMIDSHFSFLNLTRFIAMVMSRSLWWPLTPTLVNLICTNLILRQTVWKQFDWYMRLTL